MIRAVRQTQKHAGMFLECVGLMTRAVHQTHKHACVCAWVHYVCMCVCVCVCLLYTFLVCRVSDSESDMCDLSNGCIIVCMYVYAYSVCACILKALCMCVHVQNMHIIHTY